MRVDDLLRRLNFRFVTPALLLLAFTILPPTRAFAQYQIFDWASFEDGKLPAQSVPIGTDFKNTVSLVDFSTVPNPPAGFRSDVAAAETGRFGLKLTSVPAVWISGLATGAILDRDALGESGRALYQADFYIPPAGEPMPNLAVVAMEPMPAGAKRPHTFYRFGIALGVTTYFSKVVMDNTTAKVYHQDTPLAKQIPRGGWHRFAIVFEGPKTMRFYIDGREPSFSPVEESELRKLQVGIMLADQKKEYTCFADNQSIQWTPEDAPIPDSPYSASWGSIPVAASALGPPASAGRPAADPMGATALPGSMSGTAGSGGILWYDTNAGWNRCRATQAPMLVVFQAPRIPAAIELDQVFASNPAAQAFLRTCVPVKVDVNQLQGGSQAARLKVFKVPTLLLIDSSGQEKGRATFRRGDTWESISGSLSAGQTPK